MRIACPPRNQNISIILPLSSLWRLRLGRLLCLSVYKTFEVAVAQAMKDTVQALIDAHLPSIEGPADVAALMAVNYHTLRRQFKREAGVSLGRFIAERRVARAQDLLRETDLRHYEICYLVGFPSEVTGARTFKRITGQTMTDFRGAHRDSDG